MPIQSKDSQSSAIALAGPSCILQPIPAVSLGCSDIGVNYPKDNMSNSVARNYSSGDIKNTKNIGSKRKTHHTDDLPEFRSQNEIVDNIFFKSVAILIASACAIIIFVMIANPETYW